MIVGAAFCPHPPALVPAVGTGTAAELDSMRARCLAAVREVAASAEQIVVLGAGTSSEFHSPLARGSLAGFGVTGDVEPVSTGRDERDELPLSLTVGGWLVTTALGARAASGCSVGPGFADTAAAAALLRAVTGSPTALIVMGDGSARRATSSPGYVDERAVAFDDSVADILVRGDVRALGAVDTETGSELLAAGVPAWQAAAQLLVGGTYVAVQTAYEAPFGVAYFVATWRTVG